MGQNLALNIADHDFNVAVYNRTTLRIKTFMQEEVADRSVKAAYELPEFVNLLRTPRIILVMVKAGFAIDAVIDDLKPYLQAGDIIIDGGNSHYRDSERRAELLSEHEIHYIGMGVSGGEDGARLGPSLMPGGPLEAYQRVEAILKAIAAKVGNEPCVAYLGPHGVGHYVKMVHNGIEYAIMQAIAEVYDLMRRDAGMTPQQISEVFRRWNKGPLSSFLIEITGHLLTHTAADTGEPLIDLILDRAQQKGTGKWTIQDALDIAVPVPTISAAVDARVISSLKEAREKASSILQGPLAGFEMEQDKLVKVLEQALLATMICSYAQGFDVLRVASQGYDYHLDLSQVARIWRAGCIIRADMLNMISDAFAMHNNLPNLMLAPHFAQSLQDIQSGWREVVQLAVQNGIPVPAISSALAYYDSYRSARLPANLIQAQRDYFGAHTYERIDREGQFHTLWEQ
ncbi:MAG: NADP-dependent phosphogluconate dehydrogenase [Chloroflexi bacterium]|nr:NADP-dependent phosphogluconate dehydrogenase [Chloroflexota bacterium]